LIRSLLALLGIIFGAATTQALVPVPPLTAPVIDQAQLLRPETVNELNQLLRQSRSQVQVVILQQAEGEPIEQLALRFVEAWKLGDAKRDDGVLFLISLQDRKTRIEVGQGLEGDLPDAIVKRILQDVVRPYFRKGDPDSGVTAGVLEIYRYIEPEILQKVGGYQGYRQVGPVKKLPKGIVLFLILVFIVMPFLRMAGFGGHRYSRGRYGGFSGFPMGGGGFGGGGWSGGGGGFSGGGASGDW
jgi:uncharacterized protein